jgi:hypothetical protein
MAQLPTQLKERASPIWTAVVRQFERGKQWLMPRRQQAAFISAAWDCTTLRAIATTP